MTLRFMATAAGVALTLLSAAASASAEQPSIDTYRQLKLFGDVLERVRGDYVDEVTDEELIKSAIRGMLSALDPHSSYLDRDELQDVQEQTRGEFGGLEAHRRRGLSVGILGNREKDLLEAKPFFASLDLPLPAEEYHVIAGQASDRAADLPRGHLC